LLAATWEIDWYKMNGSNQKVYSLFLQAVQKTLEINAIFSAVTLETFLSVSMSLALSILLF
jgi:hypothetical protein